jgi:tetraacyldisaccharide 4'-kinase
VRTEESGDEPQIFLRSRVAPVGIGADRYRAGLLLRERFHTGIMLLDDGFQHVKLARNCDIVLLDALNPFGGGEVFPVGRLREPPYGLARAHAVIITRAEASDSVPAIERAVRHWNPIVPIFRARIEPKSWVDHRTGRYFPTAEMRPDSAGAFCALGNPQSFYSTLESLGVHPVDCVEFEDHHRYRANELERIAQHLHRTGAKSLVTTEKDAINLPDGSDDLLAPLPLYWLKVALRIDDEDQLLEVILKCLNPR